MESPRRPQPIAIPVDTLSPPTTPFIDKTIMRSPPNYSSGMGISSLTLPHLTFSNCLRLTSINPAAMSLFFGGGTGIGSDASWFLTKCDQDEKEGSNGEDRIILDALKKSLLEAASHQTAWPSTRRWDDYAILTYWTGCIGARVSNKCEVIVQSFAPQHHTSIDHPPPSPDVSFSRYAPTPKTPVTTEPSFSITFLRDIPSLTQSSTLVHPTRYPPDTTDVLSSHIPQTSTAAPQEVAGEQTTLSPSDDLEDHSDPGNIRKYFKSMEHEVDPSTFKDMVENLPQVGPVGSLLPYCSKD